MKVYIILFFCIFSICIFCATVPETANSLASNTSIPKGSPLPSEGYVITAYYHDPNYFKIFHKQHTGIDMVPPSSYTIRPVVLHATMSGIGYRYYDSCSGYAAIVVNAKYLIYLGHISAFLFTNGAHITYNEPVAYMGDTGEKGVCVTGAHVHYQVEIKENGSFVTINPLPFL